MPQLKRLPELDGLRGIAIVLVLVVHFFCPEPGGPISSALRGVVIWFWLGVDLFFVLSGYLITRILLAEIGQPGAMVDFYQRRAVRILPAYGFCLLLICVIYWCVRVSPPDWPWSGSWYRDSLLRLVTFTYNLRLSWLGGVAPADGPVGHLWSLSVEEQFYLFWPWIVLLNPIAVVRRICLWLMALAIFGKILFVAMQVDGAITYQFTLTRMDGLLAGALVAIASAQGRPLLTPRQAGWLASLSLLATVAVGSTFEEYGETNFVALFPLMLVCGVTGFAALMVITDQGALPHRLSRLLSSRILGWVGERSYGMYLLHVPLLYLVRLHFHPTWQALSDLMGWWPPSIAGNWRLFLVGLITTTLTVVAAHLMYEWLEKPVMRWGRNRRSGPNAPGPSSGVPLPRESADRS